MKSSPVAVLFFSDQDVSNSTTTAKEIAKLIGDVPIINLSKTKFIPKENECYVIVVSCWGDQELKPDMEDKILGIVNKNIVSNWIVLEIGNYFGYDDFSFGSAITLSKHLKAMSQIVVDAFSLDSFPKLDQKQLIQIGNKIKNYE